MKRKLLFLLAVLLSLSLPAQTTGGNQQELTQKITQTLAKANAGDPQAQFELGVMYRKGIIPGISETPDYKEASRWYAKAAQGGSVDGMVAHAGMLYFGLGIYGKDLKEAKKWYEKAAKKGNSHALYSLGVCEQEGWTDKPNEKKSFEYFKKASDMGSIYATNSLARCYYYGIGTEQNINEAFRLFKKSAAAGNTVSYSNLARCYLLGSGTPLDVDTALIWYERAAEVGFAPSQFFLGELYYNGYMDDYEGLKVPIDEAKAVKFLQMVVDNRSAPNDVKSQALLTLAACYRFGRGVTADEKKADEYNSRAAELGDPDARKIQEFLNSLQ